MQVTFRNESLFTTTDFNAWHKEWMSFIRERGPKNTAILEGLLHDLSRIASSENIDEANRWVPFVVSLILRSGEESSLKGIKKKISRVLALNLFKKDPWNGAMGPRVISEELLTLTESTLDLFIKNPHWIDDLPSSQKGDVIDSVRNLLSWVFDMGGDTYWHFVASDERSEFLGETKTEIKETSKKLQERFLEKRKEFLPLFVELKMMNLFTPRIPIQKIDITSLREEDVEILETTVCRSLGRVHHRKSKTSAYLDLLSEKTDVCEDMILCYFSNVDEAVSNGVLSIDIALCLMLRAYIENR